MKKILFPLFLAANLAIPIQAQPLRVLNAASFSEGRSFRAGSIISVFGSNLSGTRLSATDGNHLPRSLGGVTLTIAGVPSPLFYVSETQVNAQIDPSVPEGTATVTLTSARGTFTATITVSSQAAPGIFSSGACGCGNGAILNATTFGGGVFSVSTNGAPTYLAIFVTGLDLKTQPTVRIGGVRVPVQYFGPAPGFPGLQQINVQLVDALDGVGRVEVVVQSGGGVSNTVELVIVPKHGEGPFPTNPDNQMPNRQLASIAYVPNTSLALVADANDDVVRVLDVQRKAVTNVIALPAGAEPRAIAVNAAGTTAAVAEYGRNQLAILDLTKFAVAREAPTGAGPVGVAIYGSTAIVVNQAGNSASLIDLNTVQTNSVAVGHAPHGVAVDALGRAFITNENDGTISQIDLKSGVVTSTLGLGANTRPANIAILPGTSLAAVTEPSQGSDGQVMVINLNTGVTAMVDVNPVQSGGSSDLAVSGTTVYFANQADGSVTAVPVSFLSSGAISASPANVKVGLGARALAVDTKDNLLLVTNQGAGTVALVDMRTNQVTARLNALASPPDEGDDDDDHSDHDHARNAPVLTSFSPTSAKAATSFTITIHGTNLTGVNHIVFDLLALGNHADDHGKGIPVSLFGKPDAAFSVSGIQVNAAGTQLTAQVQLASSAAAGPRVVRIQSPNGTSTLWMSLANTFTVTK